MKTKRQNGFTLIELMVASIIGSIVILGVGMMLTTGLIFWQKAWQKANLQRDASYALQRISRSLKSANAAEMQNGGKAIKIYQQADEIEIFLDEASSDLKYQLNGGQPQIILEGNVKVLGFILEVNKVRIDLELQEDNFETHVVSTVMMRNYEG